MGIPFIKISSSSFDRGNNFISSNPNPYNWSLVKKEQVGIYLVVWIKYPNCTNYEGNKILVFNESNWNEILKQNQNKIDPHFSDNTQRISPIARFVPTQKGFEMAKKFAETMTEHHLSFYG